MTFVDAGHITTTLNMLDAIKEALESVREDLLAKGAEGAEADQSSQKLKARKMQFVSDVGLDRAMCDLS